MNHHKLWAILLTTVLTILLRFFGKAKGVEFTPSLLVRSLAVGTIVPILCFCSGYSKIDDSFIYARYIANALSGQGLVFNAGEHVNALSSPLFAYLLLGTSYVLHGNVLLGTAVLSGIFMLLACLLGELLVPFAGLILASTAYFYSLVGMETSLFMFMLLAVVALVKFEKYAWLPLACVLLVLTRFEGSLLVLCVGLRLLHQRRVKSALQPLMLLLAVAVSIFYLYLNHIYYGAYLPASATAKIAQGFSGYWGPWPTAFLGTPKLLVQAFSWTLYFFPVLAALILSGGLKVKDELYSRVVIPFWVLLLLFYVGLNASGLYFWYFAPLILFAILYASTAIPKTRVAASVAGVFILVLSVSNGRFLRQPRPEVRYVGYVQAGQWFAHNTKPDVRVAAAEIGLLGWSSERPIIDILGLTTPKNAVYVARHDSVSWLSEDKPDYIVVHDTDWPWEESAKQSTDYVRQPILFTGGVYLLKRR
jgi:arabinofuranosyltransferase